MSRTPKAKSGAGQAKGTIAELWPVSVQADLDRALAFHLEARQSPEAAEGVAAFREKRPPKWTRGAK